MTCTSFSSFFRYQCQKDKPFWILLKADVMKWQWHQPDHMQVICTSLQSDNHASTSSLKLFWSVTVTGRIITTTMRASTTRWLTTTTMSSTMKTPTRGPWCLRMRRPAATTAAIKHCSKANPTTELASRSARDRRRPILTTLTCAHRPILMIHIYVHRLTLMTLLMLMDIYIYMHQMDTFIHCRYTTTTSTA